MKNIKIFLLFLVVIVLLTINPVKSSALSIGNIQVIDEIDLPEDLNFSVTNACSEHVYFMQAAADESGRFAVQSLHIDMDNYANVDFSKVYIDLYNSNGKFFQELSFHTPQGFALELTEDTVNMYFYASVLVYNMNTQELHHYSIPDGAAENKNFYNELGEKEFICGDWKYTCIKDFDGYTQLVRSNGTATQELVHMPGTGNNFWNIFFPGLAIGAIGLVIILWVRKRQNGKPKD